MEIRFLGATGETTGSCHLVRCGGHAVLLDCGLVQGPREESYRRNRRLGFEPQEVDAVVQSHAHIDHSGKLPMLAREGWAGAIHATHGTRDLCEANGWYGDGMCDGDCDDVDPDCVPEEDYEARALV